MTSIGSRDTEETAFAVIANTCSPATSDDDRHARREQADGVTVPAGVQGCAGLAHGLLGVAPKASSRPCLTNSRTFSTYCWICALCPVTSAPAMRTGSPKKKRS